MDEGTYIITQGLWCRHLFLSFFRYILHYNVFVSGRYFIGIFGAANESVYYTDFAVKSFRIYLCMMVLATVNKGTFIFLQSVGKAKESTIISMMREIVFGVGLAILLQRFFGLDGVLYSMPISDILAFVIAFYFITKTLKSLRSEELDYRTSPT